MDVTICDFEDCTEIALFHVSVIDPDHEYRGLEFDACSVEHQQAYMDGLPDDPKGSPEKESA